MRFAEWENKRMFYRYFYSESYKILTIVIYNLVLSLRFLFLRFYYGANCFLEYFLFTRWVILVCSRKETYWFNWRIYLMKCCQLVFSQIRYYISINDFQDLYYFLREKLFQSVELKYNVLSCIFFYFLENVFLSKSLFFV